MSHLLTQCPFCQTSFKVSDEQMQAANGVVRCGFCKEVFLARVGQAFQEEVSGKTDIKQDQSSGSQPIQETFDESPFLSPDFVARESIPSGIQEDSFTWLQSVPGPLSTDASTVLAGDYTSAEHKAQIMNNLSALEDDESLALLEPEHLQAIDEPPVELVTVSDRFRLWKTIALLLSCIILLTGLAVQYVVYNMNRLPQNSRFASVTSIVCQYAACPDSQVVDLTSIITQELDVRTHPDTENALQVNFIFRNEAPREQLFPLVELNFNDISGHIVANRVFTREEYLPPEMALFTHMPAHSSIQVSLDLVDPGTEATGYSLVFRNP